MSAQRLFATNTAEGDVALVVLRLALGIVMFPHGAQKMLGWFGGPGFSGTVGYFGSMHVPAFLAVIVILLEFFGPILLILGLLTRLVALGFAIEMFVAVLFVHAPNGFFMNWTGQQKGEGFEFHIFAISVALALLIAGAGRYSIDNSIASRR